MNKTYIIKNIQKISVMSIRVLFPENHQQLQMAKQNIISRHSHIGTTYFRVSNTLLYQKIICHSFFKH